MKMAVLRDVAVRRLVEVYRRFRGAYRLCRHGDRLWEVWNLLTPRRRGFDEKLIVSQLFK
jgi:hypothetical protein